MRAAAEFLRDQRLDGDIGRRGDGDEDLQQAVYADDPPLLEWVPVHRVVLILQPNLREDAQRGQVILMGCVLSDGFLERWWRLNHIRLLLRRGIA